MTSAPPLPALWALIRRKFDGGDNNLWGPLRVYTPNTFTNVNRYVYVFPSSAKLVVMSLSVEVVGEHEKRLVNSTTCVASPSNKLASYHFVQQQRTTDLQTCQAQCWRAINRDDTRLSVCEDQLVVTLRQRSVVSAERVSGPAGRERLCA